MHQLGIQLLQIIIVNWISDWALDQVLMPVMEAYQIKSGHLKIIALNVTKSIDGKIQWKTNK